MAYKSRVTNKYMGSTFAGRVNSATKSDATDLVNILQKDVNPAISRILVAEVEKKQDTATQKMNELMLTKDAATIEKEILSGQHPELSGKYVEKTVEYHNGKLQAIAAKEKIEQNKKDYDFRETNLPAFYKQYLPSFSDKSGSFALGFASIFNDYKAKEAIIDAENRSNFAKTEKINNSVKIVLNGEKGTEWDIINKGLDYKLPPEEGGTTSRLFLTNSEKNEVAIQAADYLLNTATSVEEIDRALAILSTNRGIGKDGMNLGSLLSTKRNDVSEKVRELTNKRVTLENQNRLNKENKRTEDIRNIFTKANEPITDDYGSTRARTFAENLELRKELAKYGNPQLLSSFDAMIDKNRYVNTDPSVFTNIVSTIFEGGYDSQTELFKALTDNNVASSEWGKALTYYNNYVADNERGIKPIYATDFTYSSETKSIINTVKGNFNVGVVGMEKPNSGEAVRNASYYIRKEIIDFENRYKEENNGKSPSTEEKDNFMMKLGNVIKTRFTPENVQPSMKSFTEYEEEQQTLLEQQKQKSQKYEQAGVTDVINAINKQLELDKGLIKIPQPELGLFGKDADWFDLDKTDREEFKENTVIPFITNYLRNTLSGVTFNADTVKAMEQSDFNNMLRNIADQFQGISPIDIEKVMQNLIESNK